MEAPMERFAMNQLITWKNNKDKKPLIVKGARQVGKTYLLEAFGKNYFKSYIYLNFESNPIIKEIFERDFSISRIIGALELYSQKKIDKDETLIIFDEIQEAPKALTSLKYFSEDQNCYQIVAAGSLLGVALHKETSFPVGKVEFLQLSPMSFYEYLVAIGRKDFVEVLNRGEFELANTFKQEYQEELKKYFFIGGMPEIVDNYRRGKDFNAVRKIQKDILYSYEQDFSKHAPYNVTPRLRMAFNSLPSQLAKENKKFVYGLIKEGARAKEFELALMWLCDSGFVHKVPRVNKIGVPLNSYEDLKAFKMFALDVGLLGCMANLDASTLLDKNNLFVEFKGALSEQYVLQQLKSANDSKVFYWSNERGSAEIDFIIEAKGEIIPIEVKAKINLRAKSLSYYLEKYQPKKAFRISLAPYKKHQIITDYPLWAVESLVNHL